MLYADNRREDYLVQVRTEVDFSLLTYCGRMERSFTARGTRMRWRNC